MVVLVILVVVVVLVVLVVEVVLVVLVVAACQCKTCTDLTGAIVLFPGPLSFLCSLMPRLLPVPAVGVKNVVWERDYFLSMCM